MFEPVYRNVSVSSMRRFTRAGFISSGDGSWPRRPG